MEDVTPNNVVLNLEVQATAWPKDNDANVRLDGGTYGIKTFKSGKARSLVDEAGTDSVNWVVQELLKSQLRK